MHDPMAHNHLAMLSLQACSDSSNKSKPSLQQHELHHKANL